MLIFSAVKHVLQQDRNEQVIGTEAAAIGRECFFEVGFRFIKPLRARVEATKVVQRDADINVLIAIRLAKDTERFLIEGLNLRVVTTLFDTAGDRSAFPFTGRADRP